MMTKKHDPHKRFAKKKNKSDDYNSAKLIETEKYWRANSSIHSGDYAEHNEAFDASPDLPSNESKAMYNTFHDSGMSDLSETQYKFESDRPISQASTDSEDSGFRSSRSGQYCHSAQNSTGNEKDTPVFKPICSEKEHICAHSSLKDSDPMKRVQSSRHSYPIQKKKASHPRLKHNQKELDINEIETDLNFLPISTITKDTINMPMHHLPPSRQFSDSMVPVSYQSQNQYGPIQMTPLLTSISKSYMSTNPTLGEFPSTFGELQSPQHPHKQTPALGLQSLQHKQTVTTAMVHHRPNIDMHHNAMSFSVV